MNKLRRVVNNAVISLLGQAVTWISTLVLTIAYGRFLGDTKFGELYFAITFVALIGFPLEFGFNQQLTRDIAQEPAKALRYLSNTLAIKGVLWLLLYSCILLTCWLLSYNVEERMLVTICGLALLSTAITNTFAALHYAFERVVFPVVGTVLEKGLAALIGVLLLRSGGGVEVMALVLLGGALTNAAWQAFWFVRLQGISLTIDVSLARDLIRTSIPFLVYGVLGVIYYRIDTVLLSLLTNATVVGWYGAGYRLFDTLVFLPNLVIITIMYPVFSKLSLTDETNLKLAVEKSMNFLLFFGIPIATGLIAAAPNIIGFLYHRAEFAPSIPVLQFLAPGVVFLYINTVLTTTLISTKQEKKITIMAAAALVFNLGLNLFLIPRFQHVGAAVVTSLTELLLLGIASFLIPRHLLPIKSLQVGGKAIIASLVMALVILFLRIHVFNIFLILPVAMLVYCIGAAFLKTIPRKDLQELYRAVRHKAQKISPAPVEQPAEIELDMTAGNLMPLADEDTLLLGTAITLRLQRQRLNLPHDQGKVVEPNMTVANPPAP
jgi:O-antigen/teichoic acid export membrane protein